MELGATLKKFLNLLPRNIAILIFKNWRLKYDFQVSALSASFSQFKRWPAFFGFSSIEKGWFLSHFEDKKINLSAHPMLFPAFSCPISELSQYYISNLLLLHFWASPPFLVLLPRLSSLFFPKNESSNKKRITVWFKFSRQIHFTNAQLKK